MMKHTINNMASSITGMICDGGNQGCTMKGIAAVDAAYQSVDFAMHGIYIQDVHGINGNTARRDNEKYGTDRFAWNGRDRRDYRKDF